MSETADSGEFEGIIYHRSRDDPLTFIYIPGEPTPEKDEQGRPTLSLFVGNQGGMLQLGTQWGLDGPQLEALQSHLAVSFAIDATTIRLSPAVVSLDDVRLQLGDGTGQFNAIKSVRSSGFAPYKAIFNVNLDAAQQARAISALQERAKFLIVRYTGRLVTDVTVTATIDGHVREEFDELGSSATMAESRTLIDAALEHGRLVLHIKAPLPVPDDLRDRAAHLVREKAAKLLLEMACAPRASSNEVHLKAQVTLTEPATIPIERTTDVSSWFSGRTGMDHVQVFPSGSAPTSAAVPVENVPTTGSTVQLAFDIDDAPINFVQVMHGSAQATLRPPDFAPVTLSTQPTDERLVVTTHYTDGGAPFESRPTFREGEAWALAPEHLGLINIVVDATARKAAGAAEGRLHATYRPAGDGTEDDRTIYLRDTWLVSWYVVTRSADLDGTVEIEWKETMTDGKVDKHPRFVSETPRITL